MLKAVLRVANVLVYLSARGLNGHVVVEAMRHGAFDDPKKLPILVSAFRLSAPAEAAAADADAAAAPIDAQDGDLPGAAEDVLDHEIEVSRRTHDHCRELRAMARRDLRALEEDLDALRHQPLMLRREVVDHVYRHIMAFERDADFEPSRRDAFLRNVRALASLEPLGNIVTAANKHVYFARDTIRCRAVPTTRVKAIWQRVRELWEATIEREAVGGRAADGAPSGSIALSILPSVQHHLREEMRVLRSSPPPIERARFDEAAWRLLDAVGDLAPTVVLPFLRRVMSKFAACVALGLYSKAANNSSRSVAQLSRVWRGPATLKFEVAPDDVGDSDLEALRKGGPQRRAGRSRGRSG